MSATSSVRDSASTHRSMTSDPLVHLAEHGESRRQEFLDKVLFWNACDPERKLADFQAYYSAARSHAALDGHSPLTFAGESQWRPDDEFETDRHVAPAGANQLRDCFRSLSLVSNRLTASRVDIRHPFVSLPLG